MDIYTMTEEAYKNGYEAGVKKFAERIKNRPAEMMFRENCLSYRISEKDIDNLAKELIEHR